MITVAITGISGRVGRQVLARVRALPSVERVVGIDLHAPAEALPDDVVLHRVDTVDPQAVAKALQGADVVVHLAFLMDPRAGADRMRAVNVEGTRNVVEAAGAGNAHRVVVASSVVVYGGHPDNDVPLTEESPLRANADFPYAEHHRDVDTWLAQWDAEHPDVAVTRLRLAMVVGSGVDTVFTRALLAPRLPSVRGHRPPFQFLHVDDAAAAVAHAVEHDLLGAYNVAAQGWLSFDEAAAILGRRALDLPEEVAFTTVERLAAVGLADLPVGAVHHVMHPWVVSVDRLVATGWRPEHSNRDAAAALAADLGDRLVIGPVRTSRRQVRLATAAAGIAGALLALALLGRRRRRRTTS